MMRMTPPADGCLPTLDRSNSMNQTQRLVRIRLFGLLMIAIGLAGRWYNWHLATTADHFYIKATLLGPLGVFGGLLLLIRPDWAGPGRKDSTPAHKAALIAVIALMAVGGGIDFYLLQHVGTHRASLIPIPPGGFTPVLAAAQDLNFLGLTYRLGAFNQKTNATWEFITADETIDDWKTLLTVIDRPDARTKQEMDRLAEGIMANYKSHGARILMAKTMQDAGGVFNYMVAAFEEPGPQRYELNFVKIAMGLTNATVTIYGVRVSDPQDYRAKAKEFLDRNSGEVGRTLGAMAVPDTRSLPRKTF